jgi:hypothetical protein
MASRSWWTSFQWQLNPSWEETVELDSLCSLCRMISKAVWYWKPVISGPFHKLSDMKTSASQGCHLCSLFLENPSPFRFEEDSDPQLKWIVSMMTAPADEGTSLVPFDVSLLSWRGGKWFSLELQRLKGVFPNLSNMCF